MSPTLYILAGLLIFCSHLVAGITGFGNQVVALPLLAMLVGLDAGKGTLVVLGMVMNGYLVMRWRERINRRELARILVLAGAGLVIGMYIFERLNPRSAHLALGAFVLIMGLQGLVRPALLSLVPEPVARGLLVVGGIVHGAFTTGGPLLVIYARRVMAHKTEFRATLGTMWLVLNAGLMLGWTITGTWSPRTPALCLAGLPFMIAGLSLGEHLHHRMNSAAFGAVVNGVLVFNGIVLIASAW